MFTLTKKEYQRSVKEIFEDNKGRLAFILAWKDNKDRFTSPKLCNSYVRAFIEMIGEQMGQDSMPGTVACPDITNTNRNMSYAQTTNFNSAGAAGAGTVGIIVGTGNAAVTIADYALQTAIAHGAGAGQLQYGTTSFVNSVLVGSTRAFTMARTFTNNSGGAITVNEVGIYSYMYDGSSGRYFCIERSLSTQLINTGASATATYTIGITV